MCAVCCYHLYAFITLRSTILSIFMLLSLPSVILPHISFFTIFLLSVFTIFCFCLSGWKALHIAVFETFSEKGNIDGVKDDKAESVKNADGTVRGNLMAVCPLYVKYNR